jgi:large subunit ribosomal protein L24
MFHVKRDDKVKVISGKHKGRMGKVLRVFADEGTALVERVNFVKRHMKAGASAGQQGGIIEKEAPLPISNLMVVCPKCDKPARSGLRELEDGSRVRFCKRCDEQIDT